jgi:protein-S-isoprenylcysteine O-methyltransferase Ste14
MQVNGNTAILLSSVLALLSFLSLVLQLSVSGLIYLSWSQRFSILFSTALLIICLGMLIFSYLAYKKEKSQILQTGETSFLSEK